MKKTLYALLFILSTLFGNAQQMLLEEHFNFNSGDSLVKNGWYSHSGTGTFPIRVHSEGLALQKTLYRGNGIGKAARVSNNGSDENRPFSSYPDTGNIYASFLLKVHGQVTSLNQGYFLHLGDYTNITSPTFTSTSTAFRGRTFITTGSSADKFKLGLAFNATAFPVNVGVDATSDLDTGVTYLVVLKYSFIPGANNDSVRLYVFKDGDDIRTEPKTPACGPLGRTGTVPDMPKAQYLALRQYATNPNMIIDGIIVRNNWDIAIKRVSLTEPSNNLNFNLQGKATDTATVKWKALKNSPGTITYTWQFSKRSNVDFNNPLVSFKSGSAGADTILKLDFAKIDQILIGEGINFGDTLKGVWRVVADNGHYVLPSDSFNLNIIRGYLSKPFSSFNLTSPVSGARLEVAKDAMINAEINWQQTTYGTYPVTYQWVAALSGGNINKPLLKFQSNNNGKDNKLTISYRDLDSILVSLGVPSGDSVTLDWSVLAKADKDSQLAANIWTVKIVRSAPIIASSLVSPIDNALLNVSGDRNDQVQIKWTKVKNTSQVISYTWQFSSKSNINFSSPLLSIVSNNSGSDTSLTLTYGAIDAALASLNVKTGDTVKGVWRVVSSFAGNDLPSVDTFDIQLVRGNVFFPFKDFSLLTPANKSVVLLAGNMNQTAQITWGKTTAGTYPVTYKWIAVPKGGNLNNPVLSFNSNKSGLDSVLTLSYKSIDSLLVNVGINPGDSLTLDWTVIASAKDSIKRANEVWSITLVRDLADFNLLTPADKTVILLTGNLNQTAQITWENSSAGTNTTTYKWIAVPKGGNLNTPALSFNSNNNGINNSLTLSYRAIDSLLVSLNVKPGDSLTLDWTIVATVKNKTKQAKNVWSITLKREKAASNKLPVFNKVISIYPNPTSGLASLSINDNNFKNYKISITNNFGQEMLPNIASNIDGLTIDLSNYANGFYFIRMSQGNEVYSAKIILNK